MKITLQICEFENYRKKTETMAAKMLAVSMLPPFWNPAEFRERVGVGVVEPDAVCRTVSVAVVVKFAPTARPAASAVIIEIGTGALLGSRTAAAASTLPVTVAVVPAPVTLLMIVVKTLEPLMEMLLTMVVGTTSGGFVSVRVTGPPMTCPPPSEPCPGQVVSAVTVTVEIDPDPPVGQVVGPVVIVTVAVPAVMVDVSVTVTGGCCPSQVVPTVTVVPGRVMVVAASVTVTGGSVMVDPGSVIVTGGRVTVTVAPDPGSVAFGS